MDRYEAQYNFWSSFGVPAYEQNTVPDLDDIEFPYITYEAVSSPWEGQTIINASIWSRSTSWLEADTISNAIEAAIKDGGQILHYDGGTIWMTPEDPFAQKMGDPDDDRIRRIYLSVVIHFN